MSGPYQKDLDDILRDTTWFGSDTATVSMVTVADYSSETGREVLDAVLKATEKVDNKKIKSCQILK